MRNIAILLIVAALAVTTLAATMTTPPSPLTNNQMNDLVAGSACSFAEGALLIAGIASFFIQPLAVPTFIGGVIVLFAC
jgi:hypothetical protein